MKGLKPIVGKKGQTGKLILGIGGGLILGVVVLAVLGMFTGLGSGLFSIDGDEETIKDVSEADAEGEKEVLGCNVDPSYTYSAFDKFGTDQIAGTDRIRSDGNKPVTSLSGPPAGLTLDYWLENSTSFCEVAKADGEGGTAECGTKTLQTECYKNSTGTSVKVFDEDGDQFLTNVGETSGGNITMGANSVANLNIRYQTNADEANMPFGGCVAIETPTTISSVTLNGEGITSLKTCEYVWTYTPKTSGNTFRTYAVPDGFDADGLGDNKKISLQLKAGTSNPSGTYHVVFAPANYYITKTGEIVLGIEKDKNQDTTKTMGEVNNFAGTIV